MSNLSAGGISRRRKRRDILLIEKIKRINWLFVLVALLICSVGIATLFSAAGGNLYPWAYKQIIHLLIGIFAMFVIALTDIRFWFKFSYLAYLFGVGLLVLVAVAGVEGGLGARRWLNIGGFRFQPSELMKVFLVLALARYYHSIHENKIQKLHSLIIPLLLIGLSAGFVLKQPNLGTATIMVGMSCIVIFMGGVSWKKFAIAGVLGLMMIPVLWGQMHNYQKQRVYTFFDPESDPLGSGYNIIQSKIAIGSGGVSGKGYMNGTQSQLNFVPERQTDFIFSIVAEEFGFIGSMAVLGLYALLIFMGILIASNSASGFGRLMSYGIMTILFLHVFINTGMVMGILPVVGVPLPLLSYGGSSMISTLAGLGFVLNAHIHRRTKI